MIRQRKNQASTVADSNASEQQYFEKEKPAFLSASPSIPVKRSHVYFICIVLTALAFISRFFLIDYPDEVVFDEVHFGKFGAYYIERTYYFDVHPPLGKLLIAGAGYAGGFNGTFKFDKIGDSYIDNQIPYVIMRAPEALLGALLIPLVFMILIETQHSLPASILGASMVLFENSLVCQTRLILLDSFLIFFDILSVYFWIMFYKQRNHPFSMYWWAYLVGTGACLGLALGVKMVGLFAIALIGFATVWDLWQLLDMRRGLPIVQFMEHFVARMFGLIVVPAMVYLSLFAIHFSILNRTGPGDAFMSPKFQANLDGNRFNKETHFVPYGSNIVLMHYQLNSFLHSHAHNYPLKYEDGRISSQGQQVTGYSHEDTNNEWEVLPADGVMTETTADGKVVPRLLRNRDEVRLFHTITKRFLLTHDVASPLTTTNQEFICVDPETREPETIFRIELDGVGNNTQKISTIDSKIRLIHNATRVALHMQKGKLPDWGFGQFEVNGNKASKESNNIFVITSVSSSTGENLEAPLARSKTEGGLSFLMKFAELQQVMLDQNSALTSSHPYSSFPISWPFLTRGISFWVKDSERQIYLIGNPLVWWTASGSTLLFTTLFLIDLVALRRAVDLLGFRMRRRLQVTGMFFAVGYALHYLPFFIMGRQLFLHHYLPALIFSIMLCASVYDFIARYRSSIRNKISFVVFFILFGVTFVYFSPFVYGLKLSGDDVSRRKWLSTWDFSYASTSN